MMQISFGNQTLGKVILKLFMTERYTDNGFIHQIVFEEELKDIISQGITLNNAYIYAIYYQDTFDLDAYLYSVKLLERSFDIKPAFTFNHSINLQH